MTTKPKSETAQSLMEALLKLDGVAAVNLQEPSPGDLERVVKAYNKTLCALDQANARIERLEKALEFYAMGDYRYGPDSIQENLVKLMSDNGALARSVLKGEKK
jgi:hypothetical protein